jgi:ABC-type nitrate/sulfonate/bicarbonate transport system substrate-binding protein
LNPFGRTLAASAAAVMLLAACGGAASQPASPSASPSSAAKPAASAPASAAAKPAASASAKPGGNAGASAPAASGLTPLTVAYSQATAGFGPLYIAKDGGMFQKNGLEVTPKRITGTAQLASIVAGEVPIGALGGQEVINATAGGVQLAMLATVDDFPTFSLFANKQYKSVPDLAGQSIGITTAGSSTDATAQFFLKHFNMTGKVNITPAGGTIPAILAAMGKGLAAGMISPPVNVEAEKQGFVELVNGFKLGEPLNTAGWTVTRAWLKDNQASASAFLKSYAEAWAFAAAPANKAKMIEVLEKYTQSDQAAAEAGYDALLPVWQGKKVPTVDPKGLENIAGLSKDPKIAQIKVASFIDNSLLEAVAK